MKKETKWYRPDQRPDNDDPGAPEISQTVLLFCPTDNMHALGWFNFDTDKWSTFEDFYFVDGWMWTYPPRFIDETSNYVDWEGHRYWYRRKPAKHKVDICLATTNPKKYCNGYFLYSQKDPGDGMEYVIIKTDNPELELTCDA